MFIEGSDLIWNSVIINNRISKNSEYTPRGLKGNGVGEVGFSLSILVKKARDWYFFLDEGIIFPRDCGGITPLNSYKPSKDLWEASL